MKADEVVTVDLVGSSKDSRHTCDDVDILAELRRLPEEMVRINYPKVLGSLGTHRKEVCHHDEKGVEVNLAKRSRTGNISCA